METFRVKGPPGTGKTTWLINRIRDALEKYDAHQIYAVSFTRAAARELVGRDAPIPETNVGTIHSMCLRGLQNTNVVERDKDMMEEWNRRYGSIYSINDRKASIDGNTNSTALDDWSFHRSRLQPEEADREFVSLWEAFKKENEAIDFTDMLLQAPDFLPNCKVLFVDEAQDLTPLQWKIVRQWGANADKFIYVGDDDQVLYEFTGARPEEFTEEVDEKNDITLKQTYRLPSVIHGFASEWISQVGGRRLDKVFEPARQGGIKIASPCNYRFVDHVCSDIRGDLEEGSVMVLASCGYMLNSFLAFFRANGIPFHNPYSKERGDWNPLGKGVALEKVRAFYQLHLALSTGEGVALGIPSLWSSFGSMLRSKGALKRGAKKELARLETVKASVGIHTMDALFEKPALEAILNLDFDWVLEHLVKVHERAAGFAVRCAKLWGIRAIDRPPELVVGTIHSVKGGEADSVYLIPDLSYKAYQRMILEGIEARDSIVRQFYVGMTRTKNKLTLLSPATEQHMEGLY